ncbi:MULTISPECIES: DNA-binding protein [Massilia]|uniref:Integrase n=2 Tax=Massilia TaxID=149698 RepID=A0ABX0N8U3_9BURK|nr:MULTISPECIES: DNA-binding protein [Massilia]NHZ66579.1 integrase [Massilia genomosp. 1]NHZ93024.1 integrase [Massilia mucilaginosa]
MARTGLYLSEVKKARDALTAQGRHPSVDAVRVALGNTGSKTTIHKYLKELEEEDGGAGKKGAVSEALQDLVSRLAARLHEEANARIDAVEVRALESSRVNAEALATLQTEREAATAKREFIEAAAQLELAEHCQTRAALQSEAIARHTAEEQVAGLKLRLLENDAHRQSLEEKHTHAREALEHYRQSVKEQRDQDQRRHEQQIQQLHTEMRQLQQGLVVKQEDITRLNQDGARLVADIAHAQKSLYDQELLGRQRAQQIEVLQEGAQKSKVMAVQLAALEAQVSALRTQQKAAAKDVQASLTRAHGLEVSLATAQATLASQNEIIAALRNHLAEQENTERGGDGQ